MTALRASVALKLKAGHEIAAVSIAVRRKKEETDLPMKHLIRLG